MGRVRILREARTPDPGGELGGDLAAQRLRRSGKEVAAARSTRLRPIHFIHFIAAAGTNRGPNLLGGIRNHYKFVIFGKQKIFAAKFTFALAALRSVSTRGLVVVTTM